MKSVSTPLRSIEVGSQTDILESVNRARDAFRDFVERCDDGLVLKGRSYIEYYRKGRMALVLHCKIALPVELPVERRLGNVVLVGDKDFFIVLKADVGKPHHIEQWDQQLMLVRDVHIVQGPEGIIPTLVGFYDIHDKGANLHSARIIGDTLLFQSAVYGGYKFLSALSDWKSRAVINSTSGAVKRAVVKNIDRASEIVQNVANNQGGFGHGEPAFVDVDEQVITPFVFLDADGVKVRRGESIQKFIKVMDVLHGPFNLTS